MFMPARVKNTLGLTMKDLSLNNECTYQTQVVSFLIIFYYNFFLPLGTMKIKLEERIINLI